MWARYESRSPTPSTSPTSTAERRGVRFPISYHAARCPGAYARLLRPSAACWCHLRQLSPALPGCLRLSQTLGLQPLGAKDGSEQAKFFILPARPRAEGVAVRGRHTIQSIGPATAALKAAKYDYTGMGRVAPSFFHALLEGTPARQLGDARARST